MEKIVHCEKKHFVLVHGACHGAWCWYKVTARLKSAGHRVTAVDLAASGINKKPIEEVNYMEDYSRPLLDFVESLPQNENIVLVGHSLGGINIAFAMEKFPEKIAVGVFVTAFMPDTVHAPSYVIEQYAKRTPAENWMDTKFQPYESANGSLTSMSFGPQFLSCKLYQLSPIENLELAKTLSRTSSLFLEDLIKAKKLSESTFGSVPRVYVVCDEDLGIPADFQHWMIQHVGASDVFEISTSDHMPMFCKPQELCDILVKIALKRA